MITVLFTCNACGLVKEKVAVRYRREDEDVVAYVEQEIGEAIGLAHSILSPQCKAKQMTNVMIPMEKDGVTPLGMKP